MDRLIGLGGLLVVILIAVLLSGMTVKWWGEIHIGYSVAFLIFSGLAIIMVFLSAKENLKRRKNIVNKPGT